MTDAALEALIAQYEHQLASLQVDKHILYLTLGELASDQRFLIKDLIRFRANLPHLREVLSEWEADLKEALDDAEDLGQEDIQTVRRRLSIASMRMAEAMNRLRNGPEQEAFDLRVAEIRNAVQAAVWEERPVLSWEDVMGKPAPDPAK